MKLICKSYMFTCFVIKLISIHPLKNLIKVHLWQFASQTLDSSLVADDLVRVFSYFLFLPQLLLSTLCCTNDLFGVGTSFFFGFAWCSAVQVHKCSGLVSSCLSLNKFVEWQAACCSVRGANSNTSNCHAFLCVTCICTPSIYFNISGALTSEVEAKGLWTKVWKFRDWEASKIQGFPYEHMEEFAYCQNDRVLGEAARKGGAVSFS